MNECIGKQYILNGELFSSERFDDSFVNRGESVYEVIRLVEGIPVFFKDHIQRLYESVLRQHKSQLADIDALRRDIILLAGSLMKQEINIKIVFNYDNDRSNYLIFYIESHYPSDEDYKKGVRGILFNAERKDPGSKVLNNSFRASIEQTLKDENAYEAILVNSKKLITEGSKSNIFFLKDNFLVTAPDDLILKGITRKHILQICRENKLNVEFKCVEADRISGYESVFMTGTSPAVLPFCCINEYRFNVRMPLMERLRDLYMSRAAGSLKEF